MGVGFYCFIAGFGTGGFLAGWWAFELGRKEERELIAERRREEIRRSKTAYQEGYDAASKAFRPFTVADVATIRRGVER